MIVVIVICWSLSFVLSFGGRKLINVYVNRLLLNEFVVCGGDCSFLIELLVLPGFPVTSCSNRVWFFAAYLLKFLVYLAHCCVSREVSG